ncbi:LacI family DNA-binding transcriptional regulator [Actinotalea sp. M2MS4P-6]|uniref:LacI family DNA-binding transcriptional regulator n=1 Tax=Actinotalea sp. M2MS4P-6 TaxID=2983762 RepID=UPI0021E4DA86|nr:LacI family DNA-binding transcriptional regulator [Actinotalea sp. M2MS4P-6]
MVSDSSRRPTIYDVAEHAGVSKSLVSLVLRGSPNVSAKRRAAVEAAIDELGYTPSTAAARLAGARSQRLEVVIDDYRNLWFVDLLEGIRQVTDELGYHVGVVDMHTGAHSALNDVIASGVEGVVVAAELPEALAEQVSVQAVVAGNRASRPPGADLVANDDDAGMTALMDHLFELGHRRIGHITATGGSAGRRRAAFEAAMRRAGLTPLSVGVDAETGADKGFVGANELLDAHPELTAIVAENDTMALGAFMAARQRGLSVPGDLSLAGYDDSPLAGPKVMDLTTVDGRGTELGRQAGLALLDRIANPDRPAETILLPPELVVRSSTAPPRLD